MLKDSHRAPALAISNGITDEKYATAQSKKYQLTDVFNSTTDACQCTSLPVELWDDIIEASTDISGAYTLDDYLKIEAFCTELHGISVGNAFSEAISIKLSLSNTCRFLNHIAQRFIARYIRITSPRQLRMLMKSLTRKGTDSEMSMTRRMVERWTARVELALDINTSWMPEDTQLLCDLLSHCPSMICFSTIFTTIPDGQLGLPDILQHLGAHPSLKRLEVRMNGDLGCALQSLRSSLEVLCWRGKSRNSDICHEFPELRVLITNSDSGNPKQIIAPKLRACIVASTEDTRMTTPKPDLTVDAAVVEYLSPCLIQKERFHDLPKWTSLKAIRFTYRSLVDWRCTWPDTGSVIGSLECLLIDGFWSRLPDGTRGRFGSGHLEDNLARLTSRDMFPNLKTFKLFLPVQAPELAKAYVPDEDRGIWYAWLLASRGRGYRILVSQGVKEWVEDFWTELDAEEVFNLLYPSLGLIAQELAGTWSASYIWKSWKQY